MNTSRSKSFDLLIGAAAATAIYLVYRHLCINVTVTIHDDINSIDQKDDISTNSSDIEPDIDVDIIVESDPHNLVLPSSVNYKHLIELLQNSITNKDEILYILNPVVCSSSGISITVIISQKILIVVFV